MKKCSYCGRENDESASACTECGTEFASINGDVKPESAQARVQALLSNPVQLFRTLVAVSTIAYVIWSIRPVLGNGEVSQGVWDALVWHGYGALLPLPAKALWLMFFLYLVTAAGLWMFVASARLLFLLLTGFGLVTSILGGVQVDTALGSLFGAVTTMADGAILVMAYTNPLKARFK
jgi:hypothetical protein